MLERDPNEQNLWVSTKADRAGVSEVVNDIHRDLMNFWRVLQSPATFAEFKRQVEAIPLARDAWELASYRLREPETSDISDYSVERAVAFFVAARQSRAGTFKGFTSLTRSRTRRGVNGNVSEWLGVVDGLPAVHARLRAVVIENMPAIDLIKREDTRDTLFYCDPPYYHDTRVTKDAYAFEMSADEHAELLTVLCNLKGKFILSGYRNDFYDTVSSTQGWNRKDIEIANHAAGGDNKRRMIESLWYNF